MRQCKHLSSLAVVRFGLLAERGQWDNAGAASRTSAWIAPLPHCPIAPLPH